MNRMPTRRFDHTYVFSGFRGQRIRAYAGICSRASSQFIQRPILLKGLRCQLIFGEERYIIIDVCISIAGVLGHHCESEFFFTFCIFCV